MSELLSEPTIEQIEAMQAIAPQSAGFAAHPLAAGAQSDAPLSVEPEMAETFAAQKPDAAASERKPRKRRVMGKEAFDRITAHPFYLVWNGNPFAPPTMPHPKKEVAERECARLAQKYGGQFYLAEVRGFVLPDGTFSELPLKNSSSEEQALSEESVSNAEDTPVLPADYITGNT